MTFVESEYQNANPAVRTDIIRNVMNPQSEVAYNKARTKIGWAFHPPKTIETLKRAVLFLMVKDEADIIRQNLDHHYALGFRRFFILDNASTDETGLKIIQFRSDHADADVFYAYDYIVGHYQALKMKALDQFMQSYLHYEDIKPNWLFFVDADEFINFTTENDSDVERVNDLLLDETKNLLIFHWVQCASNTVIGNLPGEYNIFSEFPNAWPRMKVAVPKIAYRIGRGLSPIQGNHMVESFPYDFSSAVLMAELSMFMFHFPNRSVEQLRKKLLNANKALTSTKDRDGLSDTAGHWRTYYQWYIQSGDQALIHILNDHIKGCLEP